jgi:hypothetical protein
MLSLILVIIIRYKWNVINIKKLNSAIKNLALSVIAIFVIIVLGEIWLHLYPHKFTGIDKVDTTGEFSDYTSRGYLTENVFQKKEDVVRILGLGDSFNVHLRNKGKNYINYIQQKFIAHGKGTVEIINAGMEAIGPGYYWHILNKYGDLFKTDLVLVGFFVGNDFQEARFDLAIGYLIREPKDIIKKYSGYYQFRRWRLHKLLRNKYIGYREANRKNQEIKSLPPKELGVFSRDTFLEIAVDRIKIYDKNRRKKLQKNWRECSDVILKMKKWCDRRKIKLVLAIFPDEFQVNQDLRKKVFTRYNNVIENNLDLRYPHNLIVNFCRDHDIYCLDLLGPFQEEGKTRELYTLRDTHWNEAGNRLAADLIFQYLEENQLVPSRPRQ